MPRRQKQQNTSYLNSILLLVLIGVGVGIYYSNSDAKPDNDRHEQVTPDGDKHSDKITKAEGYIYFVQDRQTMTIADLELLDEVEALCNANPGLGVRSIDARDESEGATKIKALGSQKGAQPPYVIYRSKDGQKITTTPLPSTIEKIQRMLK